VNDVNLFKNYVTQIRAIWMTFDQGKKTPNSDMTYNKKNTMKGFKSNIEKDTLKNENFRKVILQSPILYYVDNRNKN
jgi:hypothetical protein